MYKVLIFVTKSNIAIREKILFFFLNHDGYHDSYLNVNYMYVGFDKIKRLICLII